MVADLREMQENHWVSEIQIDKSEFMELNYVRKKGNCDSGQTAW